MIAKLKIKFTLLAMVSLFTLLSVIIAGMNIINYNSVVDESDEILSVLSNNKGVFPDFPDRPGKPVHGFSPETPYESRYFSVVLEKSGEVVDVNTSRIASVDRETASEYAVEAMKRGETYGFEGNYRYRVSDEFNSLVRISFLDCTRSLDAFYSFLQISIGMSLFGFILVSLIIFVLSGRIIKPISDSYEKQKRFITDAGHEIKTPLTVINANADLLEMELGTDNESISDIKEQTKRLRSLTDSLVMLARMEEPKNSESMVDFPLSETVAEAARPFAKLALSQNKELICNIAPMITLFGNARSIEQLVGILLDNALKYSPASTSVALLLSQKGHTVILSVFNNTVDALKPEQMKYIFDRFYRADDSRSSYVGGHGIGLSVARAIVASHGGEISATAIGTHSFEISAVFNI